MGWAAAAGAAASALPAVLGDDGPKINPWQQAQAGLVTQNPNIDSFWGGTNLIHDRGSINTGDNIERDDTFTQRQSMSPQMQALSQALAGRAGASRGTFSSGGMPDHLKDRYAFSMYNSGLPQDQRTSFSERGDMDLSGYMPAESSYERPEFAFGVGNGPAQIGDGQPAPQDFSGMNNAQAFEYAQREGRLSPEAINWINAAWDAEPTIRSGDAIVQGNFDPSQTDLTPTNQGYYREFINALTDLGVSQPPQPAPVPEVSVMPVGEKTDLPSGYAASASEPNPNKTNPLAMSRFIQSLGGIS